MLTALLLLLGSTALAQDPSPTAEEPAPLVEGPALLELVDAAYPSQAAEERREAEVVLRLSLDETGQVTEAVVVTPAGFGFDEAAREAVMASRFAPARDASGPVPVVVDFTYAFTLDSLQAVPPPENLGGIVRQKGTRIPLAGVEIQVTVGEERFRAVTTEDGTWVLTGIPTGNATLRAVFPGHSPAAAEVEVRDGERADVDLWLRADSYTDTVAVGLYTVEEEVVVTRRTVSMDEAKAVPGTLGDPVRVIQNLPGVARPGLLSSELIIRGANPADSRVFIDGVEVPIVYHVGGLRSVMPAGMVESVDYLPGSYPVRYGRGGGGVVDIHTTSAAGQGDDWLVQWRTDLLDTGMFASGRVGKVGVSVGARQSYIQGILGAMDLGPTLSPSWTDYQLKLEGLGDGPADWSVFLFGLEDRLEVLLPDDIGDVGDGPVAGLSDAYGAHRVVGRYARPLGEGISLDVQPSVGWDRTQTGLGSDVEFRENNLRFGLRSRVDIERLERLEVSLGLDAQVFRYDSESFFSAEAVGASGPPGGQGNPLAPDSSTSESEAVTDAGQGWVYAPDVYLESRWRPLTDPDRLTIQGGVRLVTLGVSGLPFQASVDPRAAVRLQAWEGATLKGGTGLHHQPPQDQALAFLNEPAGFQRTWSSEVGIEQAFGNQGSIDFTLFNRDTTQRFVLNPDLEDPDTDPFFVANGLGRARGLEVMLRKSPVGPVSGWVSYTLSRSEQLDDPDDPASPWVLFDFDQTHILTATAQWRLPHDVILSGRYQYVTGNPKTGYEGAVVDLDSGSWTGIVSGERNGQRFAPYSSLDLRASKLWTFRSWQLDTFVDLLGVVQGQNPTGEIQAYDYSEALTIEGLPFIPSIGFEATVRL